MTVKNLGIIKIYFPEFLTVIANVDLVVWCSLQYIEKNFENFFGQFHKIKPEKATPATPLAPSLNMAWRPQTPWRVIQYSTYVIPLIKKPLVIRFLNCKSFFTSAEGKKKVPLYLYGV